MEARVETMPMVHLAPWHNLLDISHTTLRCFHVRRDTAHVTSRGGRQCSQKTICALNFGCSYASAR